MNRLPPRLIAKIEVDRRTGCWTWTAVKDRRGYGLVYHSEQRRRAFAHRYVYELLAGDPGPELDHLCKNTGCVNPDHLEPVTHAENVRRGDNGKAVSQRYAAERDCPQGHPLSGDNLYLYATKRGTIKRQCRICRRDSKRRRRAAGARD